MTMTDTGAPVGDADAFDAAEALLSRYPELGESELARLKHWFRKEASAFEIATLASKDATNEAYRQFRNDHVDKFGWRDIVTGGAILAVVVGVIAGIGFLGT